MHPILDHTRRLLLTGLAAAALPGAVLAAGARAPRVLLRSGWQIENIGDVAHTPSMLALFERHLPEAEITFWPFYAVLPDWEVAMLKARFPRLTIVQGKLDGDGRASTPELEAALLGADCMLHNSGPYTLGWPDLDAFARRTGKPYGVFGVTYGHWVFGRAERATLQRAAFAYFRDSVSLAKARADGINPPVVGLAPDAAFAFDIADDAVASAFLAERGLKAGRFLCCIPKHRFTPAWEHVHKHRELDPRSHARNEEMKDLDHQPMVEAIVQVVRQTGMQVLICNEDETETAIGKTWVWDKLPADVQAKTVWLERPWHVAEAVGVYRRSAGLFAHEMHSPIMCIANGIPATVTRWVEQSSKGNMWADFGMEDWLFNFDCEADKRRYVQAVVKMARYPEAAKKRAVALRTRIRALQDKAFAAVVTMARHA